MKSTHRHFLRSLSSVIFLFLLCTACSWGGSQHISVQEGSVPTPTPLPILLGTQPCPDAAKDPLPWTAVLGLGPGQSVEKVICGNLMGLSTLQALILVRHTGYDAQLDLFVYTDIIAPHPLSIFTLKGLVHGDARISIYNTLLTAQEDPGSQANAGLTKQWTVDLCREYKWSDATGTLTQVTFTSLFPDLTRYQADLAQSVVNAGENLQQWRLSVIQTAQHFVHVLLKWPDDTPVTIISGGDLHDIHATVQVKSASPGSLPISLSLDRLELNPDGGIWEVIHAQTPGMALTLPRVSEPFTSPLQVSGNITSGASCTVMIWDHLYTDSGHTNISTTGVTGQGAFSVSVPYTFSFQGAAQEGVVALSSVTSDQVISGLVLVKALLHS